MRFRMWIAVVVLVLSVVGATIWSLRSRDDTRLFESMVFTPAPSSVSNLEVRVVRGVDTRATLCFDIACADLERILKAGSYEEIPESSEHWRDFQQRIVPGMKSDGIAVPDGLVRRLYRTHDDRSSAFKYVATDAGMNRVLFHLIDY